MIDQQPNFKKTTLILTDRKLPRLPQTDIYNLAADDSAMRVETSVSASLTSPVIM